MDVTGSKEHKITGTLFPTRKDKNGRVLGLVLDTPDQEGYFITQNKKGDELIAFINHEVEITGPITEKDDGSIVVLVKDYRVLSGVLKERDEQLIEPLASAMGHVNK